MNFYEWCVLFGHTVDFDKILDNQEIAKRSRLEDSTGHLKTNKLEIFKKSFLSACEEVEKFNRLCKLPVQEVIPSYPEIIQDAAMIVTALPLTQVSVERLFSALRFIKLDSRVSMKEDIIEAILFFENKFL